MTIHTRPRARAPGGLLLLGLGLLLPPALALAPADATAGALCPATESAALIAGKNTTAGEVKVCNDAQMLRVTYEPTGPWCVADTNLHVAASLDGIPRTGSGNPQPDQFAYGGPPEEEPCTVTVEIPLDEIGAEDEVVIAAQADLYVLEGDLEEGAWAAGTPVRRFTERGSWATYFTYAVAEAPSTSCVCDDAHLASIGTGRHILNTLCPSGQLSDTAIFTERPNATLVSDTSIALVAYGADSPPTGTKRCLLVKYPTVPTVFTSINVTDEQYESCRTHLRVSCGQPQP